MIKRVHYLLFGFALFVAFFWNGCNRTASIPMAIDTLHPLPDTVGMMPPAVETSRVVADTGVSGLNNSSLPPIARAKDPAQLAAFLPPMTGWAPVGDLQKEVSVRDSINLSRVWQAYIMGTDTVTVQINDFAYVPSLYAPYQKYKGTYLEDNNGERVETTTIAGFPAVQTMKKQSPRSEIVLFPGNRYVVVITEDGSSDINDIRRVAQSINLGGLAALQ